MGTVFDAYFKFLPTGDQYLGRILAGMDPNLASFKTLPPHWNIENPMSNPIIKDAMVSNFITILENHGDKSYDPTGLLLRCLACLVWHSDAILDVVPRCELGKIPLFQPGSNLAELKNLVTTDPTPGVMTTATGIPPHVEVACQLKNIRADMDMLISKVVENEAARRESQAQFKDEVLEVVREGIEQQNRATGNITAGRLEEIFDKQLEIQKEQTKQQIATVFEELVGKHLGGIRQEQQRIDPPPQQTAAKRDSRDPNRFFHRKGSGAGHYWGVPQDFKFLTNTPTLDQALRLWLKGADFPGGKVRPYHKLVPKDFPPEFENTFRVQWQQFFRFVDSVEMNGEKWNADWPRDTVSMNATQVQLVEKRMWEILRARVSYVWGGRRKKPKMVVLSTWAKHILKSRIKEFGTEEDKKFLKGFQVQSRKPAQRTRKLKQAPLYPLRQETTNKRQRTQMFSTLAGLSRVQEDLESDRNVDRANGGPRAPEASFVNRALEANPTHLQWLIDTFGNRDQGYKPVPIVNGREAPRMGLCACPGCAFRLQLEGKGSHRCARCGIPVHNICVQKNKTWLEDGGGEKHFCTEQCDSIWRGDNMMM